MIFYKECTIRFSTGREIEYKNFLGLTYGDWMEHLKSLGYNLRNINIFLDDEIKEEEELISVPTIFVED